jgi:hypothetical protein
MPILEQLKEATQLTNLNLQILGLIAGKMKEKKY